MIKLYVTEIGFDPSRGKLIGQFVIDVIALVPQLLP